MYETSDDESTTDTIDASANEDDPLLAIEDLSVSFNSPDGTVEAVTDASLTIDRGETVGLVGESGSGKSVTAESVLQLVGEAASVDGEIRFDGDSLLDRREEEMNEIRGNRISMIFQDAGSSLNPVLPVGDQISETIRTHQSIPGEKITRFEESVIGNLVRPRDNFTKFEESWQKTVELFERVGIPRPERRALEYPHEYSGGMKQRAMIAMAISCQPDLLIADEPTTALDVTIEAQILDLIDELQSEFGTAVLFITHDMGVVNEVCDRVAVMYAGHIVERAPTGELFDHPKHPYTKALLESVPTLSGSDSLNPIHGRVPDPTQKPPGCPFVDRCSESTESCDAKFPTEFPVLVDDEPIDVVSHPTDQGVDSTTASGDSQPRPRRDGLTDHVVHCVLYGDQDDGPLVAANGEDADSRECTTEPEQ